MKRLLAITAALGLYACTLAVFPNQTTSAFKPVGMLGTVTDGVFKISGCGVAISPHWVVGVAHVGGTVFVQNGVHYPVEKKYFHKVSTGEPADLALFQLKTPVPNVAPVLLAPFDAPSGQLRLRGRTVTVVGFGRTAELRSDGLGWSPIAGTEGKWRRWASNRIDDAREVRYNLGTEENPKWRTQQCLVYDLDKPGDPSFSTLGTQINDREGGQAGRDSGGGWFVQIDGVHRLVGVANTVGKPEGSELPSPYHFGGLGFSVHLAVYRQWIYSVTGLPQFAPPSAAKRGRSARIGMLALAISALAVPWALGRRAA